MVEKCNGDTSMKTIVFDTKVYLTYRLSIIQYVLDLWNIAATAKEYVEQYGATGRFVIIEFENDEDATHFALTVDVDELAEKCETHFWDIALDRSSDILVDGEDPW